MDPISIIAIAALIGYSIFKEFQETPAEKATREKAEYEWRKKRLEEESNKRIQQEAWEALERERKTPFNTAIECFQKQYVSYARIKTYCSCPQRFKLIYLDKKFIKDYDDFNHFLKGKVFHKAIENYLRDYIGKTVLNLDHKRIISEAYHLKYLRNISKYYPEDRKASLKKKMDIFKQNVKFLCASFPHPVNIVAVEHELNFKIYDINFYGIVDLVLKYPDGHLEIVDYKTGMKLPTKEQLEIYSIPFAKETNFLPINFRVISIDKESHYIWRHNKQEAIESANNILRIVNTIIDDNSFMPAIGSHCESCSVREMCQYSEEFRISGKEQKLSPVRYLTILGSYYKWVPGQKMPKSMDDNYERKKQENPRKNRGDGQSFSLSKAKKEYSCLKTKRIIRKDEFHFVDHKGNRYCIDAFMELYPDRAKKLLEPHISNCQK